LVAAAFKIWAALRAGLQWILRIDEIRSGEVRATLLARVSLAAGWVSHPAAMQEVKE